MLLSEWDLVDESHVSHPPPMAEAASRAPPPVGACPEASTPSSNELQNSIDALTAEIAKLRAQADRSTTTHWIVVGVVSLLIIVCLGVCHHASKQLTLATDALAHLSYGTQPRVAR